MYVETAGMPYDRAYKLLSGSIVPRPIAFISTLSPEGVPNCAPFSFCNVVSTEPPMVGVAVGRRHGEKKDTIANAEHTGDFVVNVTVEAIREQMTLASIDFPPGLSEFAEVGLTPAPSRLVRAPRIAESPVNMECKVEQILRLGESKDHRHDFMIGRVVAFHYRDDLLDERHRMDFAKLQPVGRMAGTRYVWVRDFYDMVRLNFAQYLERKGQESK